MYMEMILLKQQKKDIKNIQLNVDKILKKLDEPPKQIEVK